MARAALILAFLSMCLFTSWGSSDEACSSDQCNAGNNSGLGLIQTRGDLKKVQVATADEDADTDLDKLREKQGPLAAGAISVGGRGAAVHVPAGQGPFPVFMFAGPLETVTGTPGHIVVAFGRWDTDRDLEFYHALMDYLSGFSNVVPTGFKIGGHSKGGDNANGVAIQSEDPRITHLITFMSQLHVRQYHDGSLRNSDGTPKASILPRKLIQFTGLQDGRCVCCDSSVPTCGGYLLTWEESAYRFAQAWGYTGEQLQAVESDVGFSVSYLDGQVEAINFKHEGHGVPTEMWNEYAPSLLAEGPSSSSEATPRSNPAPAPPAAPAPPPAPAPASVAATTEDNYRLDRSTAGARGVGECTCPSGAKYLVGDRYNNCGSLACEGGVSGQCRGGRFSQDQGAGMAVTCAAR